MAGKKRVKGSRKARKYGKFHYSRRPLPHGSEVIFHEYYYLPIDLLNIDYQRYLKRKARDDVFTDSE